PRKIDDVAFLNSVLDDLAGRFPVDGRRVFATGFSNGASMTFRLAAERAERLAGVAPVSGFCLVDGPPAAPRLPAALPYRGPRPAGPPGGRDGADTVGMGGGAPARRRHAAQVGRRPRLRRGGGARHARRRAAGALRAGARRGGSAGLHGGGSGAPLAG